ncbi:MAG: tail fiber domain-containing protein [Chitinophagales bacterium]
MKQFLLIVCLFVGGRVLIAQTNIFPTTGNVGIGTITPAQLFQVTGGISQLGGLTDYARFANDGDLSFTGNADYLVGGDRFAFRYQGNQNFGLVFSATNSRYEFRDGTGIPVFWQGGNGNAYIKGFLSIGSTTTPNAALEVTSTNAAAIKINPYGIAAGNTGGLRFLELAANGVNYVGFRSPDNISNNKTWVLPGIDGTSGQYLKTDGAGNLGWASDAGTTYIAGTGINITGTTINNIAPDQLVTLIGTGAASVTGTYPNFTINSTDNNTIYSAGSGIDVTGTIITNTAPDQAVNLIGDGATSVTGTYPNFTISSTDINTTYTAGSGIDVTGTVITNTLPDQTVSLTGTGATSVTGSYPDFTINSTDLNTIYTGGSGIDITGTVITNTGDINPADDANTSLSNLSSTSINQSLNPDANNTRDMGSAANSWKNIYSDEGFYLDDVKIISNTGGSTFFGAAAGNSNTTSLNTGIGKQALFNNTSGYENVAVGEYALFANNGGFKNTAIGIYSLTSNTSGFNNTASGYQSLYSNTSGDYNTASGHQSLYNNTDGNYCTAIGNNALYTNSTGNSNVAVGHQTMYYNSTGTQNTATGNDALRTNSTGTNNTAMGFQSLFANTVGNFNTAFGNATLANNTTGIYNTAAGNISLNSNTTGSYNTAYGHSSGNVYSTNAQCTFLGYDADQDVSALTNSTAVGAASRISASNQVRIGSSTVTSIGGFANWTNVSDGRYKENVQENVPGLEFITELNPVTYTLDVNGISSFLHEDEHGDEIGDSDRDAINKKAREDKSKIVYSGFIAQDVEAAANKIGYDFSGVDKPENENSLYGLRYAEFVVPLVKAVQELNSLNQIHESRTRGQDELIESLKSMIEIQQSEIDELKTIIYSTGSNDGVIKISPSSETSVSLLGQNIPNPFENSTIIPFRIPKGCADASIVFTEVSTGRIVRAIPVSCGETQLSIDAGLLPGGTYSYSLFIDGEIIDTRQMVIAK